MIAPSGGKQRALSWLRCLPEQRHLGPRPNLQAKPSLWRSFMTDDYSPVEFSWCWDTPETSPKVRYSIEAIGNRAGTREDPFNMEETLASIQELKKALPGTDWQWFEHFSDHFTSDISKTDRKPRVDDCDPTSVLLAFELQESGPPAAKAYFVPVKADQLRQPRISAVSQAIDKLRVHCPKARFSAYDSFSHFLNHSPVGSRLSIVGVAVDCTVPEASRLKIYARSPSTSFRSVREIMSLDGKINYPNSAADFAPLRKLWFQLLSLETDICDDDDLRPSTHGTAGILYHFDVASGKDELPEVKVYIPVKHYGRDDYTIGENLVTYLREEGRATNARNFREILKAMSPHRKLDARCGIQT
ncbi:MAG: hypothetical protein Q9179_007462, partial [Wetmoreana sp. 5 TL-2023]